jgi:hypothetical protein
MIQKVCFTVCGDIAAVEFAALLALPKTQAIGLLRIWRGSFKEEFGKFEIIHPGSRHREMLQVKLPRRLWRVTALGKMTCWSLGVWFQMAGNGGMAAHRHS